MTISSLIGHAVSRFMMSLPDQFLCMDLHAFSNELGSQILKSCCVARCEVFCTSFGGETSLHFGMSDEVILQTIGHWFALRHKDYLRMIQFLKYSLDK